MGHRSPGVGGPRGKSKRERLALFDVNQDQVRPVSLGLGLVTRPRVVWCGVVWCLLSGEEEHYKYMQYKKKLCGWVGVKEECDEWKCRRRVWRVGVVLVW